MVIFGHSKCLVQTRERCCTLLFLEITAYLKTRMFSFSIFNQNPNWELSMKEVKCVVSCHLGLLMFNFLRAYFFFRFLKNSNLLISSLHKTFTWVRFTYFLFEKLYVLHCIFWEQMVIFFPTRRAILVSRLISPSVQHWARARCVTVFMVPRGWSIMKVVTSWLSLKNHHHSQMSTKTQ